MTHWIFDLDGTLVDSFAHYFETMGAIFGRYERRFTPELHWASLTEPVREFLARNLGDHAVPGALGELHERSNEDARWIRPFPGVVDILQTLSDRNARIGVWTSRDRISAQLILDHSGLGKYVECLVTGSCVVERKPHPEGLVKVAGFFECDPAEVTMVGDHEHDMMAARGVDAHALRASWHAYWPIERCAHADRQFFTTSELAAWLSAPPPSGG